MATVSTSEFKSGLKVMIDGEPFTILENEFVKPGKGQAFNRVKLRNLKNARVIERTFKSGESLELADILELDMQYLYQDGDIWHFMDPKTYEQYEVNSQIVADAAKWLTAEDVCVITLWDNEVILVSPPNFVVLTVEETDPGLKGDTSGGGSKPATLETQAIVKVPLFIQIGEKIRIDTRTGEYVGRHKN